MIDKIILYGLTILISLDVFIELVKLMVISNESQTVNANSWRLVMDLKEIRENKEFYEKLEEILTREPSNDVEDIFLKYVEFKRTADVADYLNKLGRRIESKRGERLWISTDVTAVLDNVDSVELVHHEVYDLVKKMQKSRRLNSKMFD